MKIGNTQTPEKMKNSIILISCFLNLSMAAQWNSKKITDEQWDDKKKPETYSVKHNKIPLSKPPVIQNDIALDLFPDPSSGISTINLENIMPQTNVCVYDAWGKCVLNEVTMKKNEHVIDLSSQPRGIYFIEILAGDEKVMKKIVVD